MSIKLIKFMESLKEFIVNNWQYIGIGLVVILDVIIMIIKRRPKKFDELFSVITQVLAKVPGFIKDAEDTKGYEGQDKKSFVVSWCFQTIENMLKRDLTISEEQYAYKAISWMIESVLECPTKKGGYGRESDLQDE